MGSPSVPEGRPWVTKQCSLCGGTGRFWTDCGDSTCDCDGSTYDCRCGDGRTPDYQASFARAATVARLLAEALDAAKEKAGGSLWPEVLVDDALRAYAKASEHSDEPEASS